jgi:AcrR family transcriptional regulator
MVNIDEVTTAGGDEPSWKQRAVERSTRAAKLRAEQRVQRFLDAAQFIITDKGTTDFTVQEVVDVSRQSLRSFYQHFDGKHELLLALFEDALRRATIQIAAAADAQPDPIDALRTAVQLLFELSRPDPDAHRALFTEFAPRLLLTHPAEVRRAHAPLLDPADGADGAGWQGRAAPLGGRAPARRGARHGDGHVHRADQRRTRPRKPRRRRQRHRPAGVGRRDLGLRRARRYRLSFVGPSQPAAGAGAGATPRMKAAMANSKRALSSVPCELRAASVSSGNSSSSRPAT